MIGGVPIPAFDVMGLAALLWLGRHSLDAQRLTDPPRDNAYYYFTRLLQVDPGNAEARAGMLAIAARVNSRVNVKSGSR